METTVYTTLAYTTLAYNPRNITMPPIGTHSVPFSWPSYFVACWSRRALHLGIHRAARAFRLWKAFLLIKFRRFFEGWLLRRHRRKALLIGIRYDDDPNTETLAGPHRDVQSLKKLLISEWYLLYNIYSHEPDTSFRYIWIQRGRYCGHAGRRDGG